MSKRKEDLSQSLEFKKNYLYDGTTLLQVEIKKKIEKFEQFREKYGLPIYVTRTNFATMKGQLIRTISFPSEKKNEFQREALKFLLYMFGLAVSSYSFIVVRMWNDIDFQDILIQFLDFITITVPFGLPISMTFGSIFALDKMKEKSIYCISPKKVVDGGQVDFVCFDKTGTLTEDFMDLNCLVPVQSRKFGEEVHSIKKNGKSLQNPLTNMAVNHTLAYIESKAEIAGDPMEIKLF